MDAKIHIHSLGRLWYNIALKYPKSNENGEKMGRFKNLSQKTGISNGIRTHVAGMRTRCPRPLDDGDAFNKRNILQKSGFVKRGGVKKQRFSKKHRLRMEK